MVSRFQDSEWLPRWPPWILEQNNCSNSESLCHSYASIKFQLNQTYGLQDVIEEFQDGRHGCYLGFQNGTILTILNLYAAPMPPIKFQLNLTYGFGGDVV